MASVTATSFANLLKLEFISRFLDDTFPEEIDPRLSMIDLCVKLPRYCIAERDVSVSENNTRFVDLDSLARPRPCPTGDLVSSVSCPSRTGMGKVGTRVEDPVLDHDARGDCMSRGDCINREAAYFEKEKHFFVFFSISFRYPEDDGAGGRDEGVEDKWQVRVFSK